MGFEFNNDVLKSLSILESHGFEAYIVGGSIRNYLLNINIIDYDVTTNAKIEDISLIFKDYKSKIYNSNKCINVKINDTRIEISPFKGDTILDDLSNRDFTVNALAYNPKYGLIDPYNGIDDINNKILKSIKINLECFKSDPLRILRGIRFEVLCKLIPNDELYNDMIKYSYMLNDVHPMRIRKEIDPIFVSNKPSIYINKYKEVFFVLFPGLDKCYNFNQHSKWHSYDVFNHILNVIDNTPNELIIRLIAFFHDIKKPECFKLKDGEGHFKTHQIKSMEYAEEYLKKYAYNKEMIDIICKIILYHDERLKNDDDIIKFIAKFGYDNLDLFYQIQIADMKGQNPNLLYRVEEYQNIINRIDELIKAGKTMTYKELQIKKNDLIELNISNPDKVLFNILINVINKNIPNERKKLLEFSKTLKNI